MALLHLSLSIKKEEEIFIFFRRQMLSPSPLTLLFEGEVRKEKLFFFRSPPINSPTNDEGGQLKEKLRRSRKKLGGKRSLFRFVSENAVSSAAGFLSPFLVLFFPFLFLPVAASPFLSSCC